MKNRPAITKAVFQGLSFVMIAVLSLFLTTDIAKGQVVSSSTFFDDFNRAAVSPGGTPSMTYTSTVAGGTIVTELNSPSTTDYGLKLVANATTNTAERQILTGPVSKFFKYDSR